MKKSYFLRPGIRITIRRILYIKNNNIYRLYLNIKYIWLNFLEYFKKLYAQIQSYEIFTVYTGIREDKYLT